MPPRNPGNPGTSPASASPSPTNSVSISEFVVPGAGGSIQGLTNGPDGNVWFTLGLPPNGPDIVAIAKISPAGLVTEYNEGGLVDSALAANVSNLGYIAAGGSQTLWFMAHFNVFSGNTYESASCLYQASTSGNLLNASNPYCVEPSDSATVESLAVESGQSGTVLVAGAVAGSSGQVSATRLQEITASGTIIALNNTPSSGILGSLADMVQATSGTVWATWTNYGSSHLPAITEISQNGTITPYALLNGYSPADGFTGRSPNYTQAYATNQDVTIAPGGTVWIALCIPFDGGAELAEIANGNMTLFPLSSQAISGITTGPDGAIWFTEPYTNRIGRMTSSGALTEYAVPTAAAGLGRIVAGPNNTLWFTEVDANKIGRISL